MSKLKPPPKKPKRLVSDPKRDDRFTWKPDDVTITPPPKKP